MTLAPFSTRKKNRPSRKTLWFERVMATVALLNYLLVLLDLSYIPLRNFYRQYLPRLTVWYGETFKGIEPHRFTEGYLDSVNELDSLVAETSLGSPEVAEQLEDLRTLSVTMINENPFQSANKTATLERIKARMRDRMGLESATESFETFWTDEYLRTAGWSSSIQFFRADIQPLMETNYFRGLDITGRPVDRFWLIDQPFVILFLVEFLLRTLYLSRRYKGANWLETMFWRWYDVLLFLPFWRWLRFIPVSIRLAQADIFNVLVFIRQLKRDFVTNFAYELTEVVVVQAIDQVQELIEEGEVASWFLDSNRRYVDINGIDEVALISKRLSNVMVNQVLPAVKPDLDALLQHNVNKAAQAVPLSNGIHWVPGGPDLADRLTQRLASEISQNLYTALQGTVKDEKGAELSQALIQSLVENFRNELRQGDTLNELQYLLVALLDEVKVNYIQRVEAHDIEDLEAKTQRIYELTNQASPD
jgi:hypothetical protein